MSISFKAFFGFVDPQDDPDKGCEKCDYSEPGPFDARVALPCLIMLLVALPLWWLLITIVDSGIWKHCFRVP